jgi:hypothetical protein
MCYGLSHTTNTVFGMKEGPVEYLIPRFTDTELFIRQTSTQQYFSLQKNGSFKQNNSITFENPKSHYANPEKSNSITCFVIKILNEKHWIPIPDNHIDFIKKIQQKKGSIFCAIDNQPYRILPQETKPIADIINIQDPIAFKIIKPILYMRQKNTEEYFHFSEDGTLTLDSSIKFNNPTIFYTDPQAKENSIAYFKIEISKKTYYLPLTKEQVNEIKENKGSIFCTINQKEYRIYPQEAKKSILSYLKNIGLIGFFVLLIIQTFNPSFIDKLYLHFY